MRNVSVFEGDGNRELEIPKVRKLTSEIKDVVVNSSRSVQFQGLQRPQKSSEIFLHLWNG